MNEVLLLVMVALLKAVIGSGSDPCFAYTEIDDEIRSTACKTNRNLSDGMLCDEYLVDGWYRFVSEAGGELATNAKIPSEYMCGTHLPIYMNGTHPESYDIENRTACIDTLGIPCYESWTIQVKRCSGYFVYYLVHVIGCDKAYCAGTELRCPEGKTSPTGFTPGCYIPTHSTLSTTSGNLSVSATTASGNVSYVSTTEGPKHTSRLVTIITPIAILLVLVCACGGVLFKWRSNIPKVWDTLIGVMKCPPCKRRPGNGLITSQQQTANLPEDDKVFELNNQPDSTLVNIFISSADNECGQRAELSLQSYNHTTALPKNIPESSNKHNTSPNQINANGGICPGTQDSVQRSNEQDLTNDQHDSPESVRSPCSNVPGNGPNLDISTSESTSPQSATNLPGDDNQTDSTLEDKRKDSQTGPRDNSLLPSTCQRKHLHSPNGLDANKEFEFRNLLLNIYGGITDEKIEDIKFLLDPIISQRDRKEIVNSRVLCDKLLEVNLICSCDTSHLESLLFRVGLIQLGNKLKEGMALLNKNNN